MLHRTRAGAARKAAIFLGAGAVGTVEAPSHWQPSESEAQKWGWQPFKELTSRRIVEPGLPSALLKPGLPMRVIFSCTI